MMISLAFGEPDYENFQNRVTRRQYLEWVALYQIQPFGVIRGDYQAATVARAIAGGKLTDHMPLIED
jgi:hypothetical protein